MAPDRPCADAAANAAADDRGIMHGAAVSDAHDVAVPSDSGNTKTSTSGRATVEPEITRRDVHTASSISAQRRFSKSGVKESSLAHQAALRRSSVKGKGKGATQEHLSKSSSAPTSKPVLVRAPSRTDMKKKPKTTIDTGSPQLPPLESFSIQDILNTIGPEADASIDAIAEICGRSKMSLADEHGSHRPPHIQVNVGSSPAESLPSMRLETVAETASTGPQTRSKSKRLSLANASLSGDPVSSDATAATSNVISHAHNNSYDQRRDEGSSDSVQSPLLSQIFTWLRGSNAGINDANVSDRDPRAARVLRSMLSDADSVRS